MKTLKHTTKAWLSEFATSRNADPNNPENLTFSDGDMAEYGWTHVGEADITVTLHDAGAIQAQQVATLREAKRRIQAEAQMHITQIDGQIQSLLALPAEV